MPLKVVCLPHLAHAAGKDEYTYRSKISKSKAALSLVPSV